MGKDQGFTLIELSVVLIIMALVVGLALPSVMSVSFTRLKGDAERLLSLFRYVADVAVTRGIDIRVEVNLDEGSWKVEYNEEGVRFGQSSGGELIELYKMVNGLVGFDDALSTLQEKRRGVFRELKDRITKDNHLSDGVSFTVLKSAHVPDGVESGQVGLYFLSTGMIEPFVLVLSSGEDSYSLVSEQLTGRIRMFEGDVSDEFERISGEEESLWNR